MNESTPATPPSVSRATSSAHTELGEYAEAVLDVVDQVPAGSVTTYGRIAEVLVQAGLGGGPRSVGAVLAAHGGAVAWWRVLPAAGTAPVCDPSGAHTRWYEEGTPLRAGSVPPRVDLRRALVAVSAPAWALGPAIVQPGLGRDGAL